MKMLALALFIGVPAFAAHPISNGSLQIVSSLAQAEAIGSGWIGYQVPTVEPVSMDCRDDDGISIRRDGKSIDLRPAGESVIDVFARLEGGRIAKLRVYSPSCTLDAGGGTVIWIDKVPPGESIAFLRQVVESGAPHASNGALLALAFHANAIDTLIDIARNSPDPHIRSQALFWLAQRAGEKAASALHDAVENDPEESVRSRAVFGIAQLPDDQSIPMLVDLLEHNRSREVRKKAAFWLGQKNDPRALAAIEEILRR